MTVNIFVFLYPEFVRLDNFISVYKYEDFWEN